MRTRFVFLLVIVLLESVLTLRLQAQSAAIKRGEKISAISPFQHGTNLAQTNASSAAVTGTNQPAAIQNGDFVGFDILAGFPFPLTSDLEYSTNAPVADPLLNAMIPANIRAADGKVIRVNGYMMALDYDRGKTSRFILARNPSMCHFGEMLQVHEMIEVKMKTGGVPDSFVPVQVRGVLRVGAKRDGNLLVGIYQLEGEAVREVEE